MVNAKGSKKIDKKPNGHRAEVSRVSKHKVGKVVGADKQSEAFAKGRLEAMSMLRSSLMTK